MNCKDKASYGSSLPCTQDDTMNTHDDTMNTHDDTMNTHDDTMNTHDDTMHTQNDTTNNQRVTMNTHSNTSCYRVAKTHRIPEVADQFPRKSHQM